MRVLSLVLISRFDYFDCDRGTTCRKETGNGTGLRGMVDVSCGNRFTTRRSWV